MPQTPRPTVCGMTLTVTLRSSVTAVKSLNYAISLIEKDAREFFRLQQLANRRDGMFSHLCDRPWPCKPMHGVAVQCKVGECNVRLVLISLDPCQHDALGLDQSLPVSPLWCLTRSTFHTHSSAGLSPSDFSSI